MVNYVDGLQFHQLASYAHVYHLYAVTVLLEYIYVYII